MVSAVNYREREMELINAENCGSNKLSTKLQVLTGRIKEMRAPLLPVEKHIAFMMSDGPDYGGPEWVGVPLDEYEYRGKITKRSDGGWIEVHEFKHPDIGCQIWARVPLQTCTDEA